MVSQGRDTVPRFEFSVMLRVVVTGHFNHSMRWKLVLKTAASVRGPRPRLQFSILGRFSSRIDSRILRVERFREARLGSPVRIMLSTDSRVREEIERNFPIEIASRVLIDRIPLNSMSFGASSPIATLPLKNVHLPIAETSSAELMVKLVSFLQSVGC
jgi:hypothetical protein